MIPRDPHVLEPGHAPTPFTAEEIREGCPPGRTIRLLIEPEGRDPFLRINRFVNCDSDGADVEHATLTVDGDPMGPAEVDRETWLGMQAHASFPVDRTDVQTETIETPLGIFECRRYTVVDGPTAQTSWFAMTVPGMPVKYTTAEAGRVVNTVTMIANEMP